MPRTRLAVSVVLLGLMLSPLFGRGAAPVLSAAPAVSAAHLYTMALSFEPNRGQVNPQVRFLAHTREGTVFLTKTEMVLSLHAAIPRSTPGTSAFRPNARAAGVRLSSVAQTKRSIVRLIFDGANTRARFAALDRLPGTVNYFIGKNPRTWHTGIPTYGRVALRNLYPGVDLVYGSAARGSRLEYSWILRPGARPAAIKFHLEGAGSFHVGANGVVSARVGASRLAGSKPLIYQPASGHRHAIPGGFVQLGHGEIGLQIHSYDHRMPLVVDPVLSYGTYLGGSNSEQGLAIAANSRGDAYVAGDTASNDFPTDHALQSQNLGDTNIFVGKFNPSGTALLFSTYIGGSATDEGLAIAVDEKGSPYVTGDTLSVDYPTVHPFQNVNRSQCTDGSNPLPCPNAIVTKLSPSGNSLVYSTYLGGNIDDQGYGIALDRSGSAYITGATYSTNFPTVHALQPHNRASLCPDATGRSAPCSDAFVARLDPSGSTLIYSTYLGGSSNDEANGIGVDTRGDAYICGDTTSADFPTTNSAAYPRHIHGRDAFVTALNPSGSALIYGTYLGGQKQDMCVNIAVRQRSAYATGYTWSSDFPTTVGALDRTPRSLDAFVTKLGPTGSVAYSTLLGGTKDDEAMGITIDTHNDAYVVGDTTSTNFPVQNAAQPHNAGQTDAFISELNPAGSGLVHSTYLGGTNLDYGHAIALDRAGNVYVTGFTYSKDFPTVHALRGPSGDDDAFVGRIGNRTLD